MSEKINYQKIFKETLEGVKQSGKKPSLLLHACCAPCSSAVLESIYDYFDITIYYHNPNISPQSEFDFRKEELKRLLEEMKLTDVKLVFPQYDYSEFQKIADGLETAPEGSTRCFKCYRLRLQSTAEYAKENGFEYFTTTLSVSPYKNAQVLNEIGAELSREYNVKYLFSDFKKDNGYKRSCELSKEYSLYRQNYCGCVYSKRD